MTDREDRPVTDHTATLDRPQWRRPLIEGLGYRHETGAHARRRREVARAGTEARLIVQGGLLYPDAETLDAAVRDLARDYGAPLTAGPARADAARRAAALILGYVTTHPVADAAELDYVADLRALRRLQASRRRLQRAVWAARGLHARARAASHALVAFAHPVHNPVENSTGVVL